MARDEVRGDFPGLVVVDEVGNDHVALGQALQREPARDPDEDQVARLNRVTVALTTLAIREWPGGREAATTRRYSRSAWSRTTPVHDGMGAASLPGSRVPSAAMERSTPAGSAVMIIRPAVGPTLLKACGTPRGPKMNPPAVRRTRLPPR
jgi:hypothetical protein